MVWLWVAAGVLAFILIALHVIACYLTHIAVDRDFAWKTAAGTVNEWEQFNEQILTGGIWFNKQHKDALTITSFDGLKLCGWYIHSGDGTRTIVLAHGYRSVGGAFDFGAALEHYASLGLDMLIIDQRAHGKSEGRHICFGVNERYDLVQWVELVNERYSPRDIFVGGISMGCSTVLMASGIGFPDNVRGIIADCGFTSPYAEFSHIVRKTAHVSPGLILWFTRGFVKHRAHFDMNVSTIPAMKSCTVPVLFIHGGKDDFVPTRFSRENYEACASEKELIIVEQAGHGLSYLYETERCQRALVAFIDKYTTKQEVNVQ